MTLKIKISSLEFKPLSKDSLRNYYLTLTCNSPFLSEQFPLSKPYPHMFYASFDSSIVFSVFQETQITPYGIKSLSYNDFATKLQNSSSVDTKFISIKLKSLDQIGISLKFKRDKKKSIGGELWRLVNVRPQEKLETTMEKITIPQTQNRTSGKQRWKEVQTQKLLPPLKREELQKTEFSEEENKSSKLITEEGKPKFTSMVESSVEKNFEDTRQNEQFHESPQQPQSPDVKKQSSSVISFFAGPCSRKNLFSCLDASVVNQEIVWVEPKYH